MLHSDAAHALLIFGLAFVLEDLAVLGAALLVVNSMVPLAWAAGSSFAGIWLGDLGLYFLALHFGRPVLQKSWFRGSSVRT
jgi:membrane protein DedA with SNARE-associated domain